MVNNKRLADSVDIVDEVSRQHRKVFTEREFRRAMNSSSFVGAVCFWRALEKLVEPEPEISLHAMGMLRQWAERAFDDCMGFAFSPQQAESFKYCGLMPIGVRSPGSVGV